MALYPLTFETIFKEKIWGGRKINTLLGKDLGTLANCGETWEVSDVEGDVSVVKEGALKGQSLRELVRQYKGELVGRHVYEQYGERFPLLVKFLDANDDLSIQVHPNDELAAKRGIGYGKTEMWYILQADEGARLNSGFNRELSQAEYIQAVADNTLHDLLNMEEARPGDVFFLPAGRVHYIGKGLLLAEIQQTSDTTYRIYDFDRVDAATGQKRELHTEQAIEAIDYRYYDQYKTAYTSQPNEAVRVVESDYFVTSVINLDAPLARDYAPLDSFVILICVMGSLTIETATGHRLPLALGESVLLPATVSDVTLHPDGPATVLETYVP